MDEPPLPITPPPPPHAHLHYGARRLRIHVIKTSAGASRRAGFQDIVILARAPLPDGSWALLAAWLGAWQHHAHTTGGPRWAWLRYTPPAPGALDPAQPMPRSRQESPAGGIGWHGQPDDGDFARAILLAAGALPAEVREQALTPLPDP